MPIHPAAAPASAQSLPDIRLALSETLEDVASRLLAALGVAGIALIHVLDASDTYSQVRWIFWAYLALIAGAVPVAVALLQWRDRRVWVASLTLAAAPFVSYLLSRSVGLPGDSADKGNWLDTLGMASLVVEALVITLSSARLKRRERERVTLGSSLSEPRRPAATRIRRIASA